MKEGIQQDNWLDTTTTQLTGLHRTVTFIPSTWRTLRALLPGSHSLALRLQNLHQRPFCKHTSNSLSLLGPVDESLMSSGNL